MKTGKGKKQKKKPKKTSNKELTDSEGWALGITRSHHFYLKVFVGKTKKGFEFFI